MLTNNSRYRLSTLYIDDAERIFTGFRDRIFYDDVDDVISHEVQDGDTWRSLAYTYYKGNVTRSAGLWWAIADFQPTPVLDPTIKLKAGEIVFIPPLTHIQQALTEEPT